MAQTYNYAITFTDNTYIILDNATCIDLMTEGTRTYTNSYTLRLRSDPGPFLGGYKKVQADKDLVMGLVLDYTDQYAMCINLYRTGRTVVVYQYIISHALKLDNEYNNEELDNHIQGLTALQKLLSIQSSKDSFSLFDREEEELPDYKLVEGHTLIQMQTGRLIDLRNINKIPFGSILLTDTTSTTYCILDDWYSFKSIPVIGDGYSSTYVLVVPSLNKYIQDTENGAIPNTQTTVHYWGIPK